MLVALIMTAAIIPCGGMASCNPNPCPPDMPYADPITGMCTTAPSDGGVIVIPGTDPPIPGTGGLPREPGTTTQPTSNPDPNAVDLLIYGLGGRWVDNGREVCIQHTGSGVYAWYIQDYECDHNDGTGNTSSTNVDFQAQLAGNVLTGTTSVCSHGHDDPADNGIKSATMTATVSEDGKTISGTWHNTDTDSDDPLTLTRETVGDCHVQ